MKKVGVVICNYNKEDVVLECIKCVLESRFQDFDLYVVDNGSTDDSVQKITAQYEGKLVLIENKENLGGSGGFNTGLRVAYEKGYPYLMCIDNDAMLDENAIENLYSFLEQHEEVGMAASKIYHLEAPSFVQQFGQKIDFDYYCTEAHYYNAVEDGSMPDFMYVDCVAACSLMVRRSVIEQIGFLPEENFLYWDDTEWCYRCNLAGYKVASVGTSKALHAMGTKNEAVNTFPTYYAWRNWIQFFMKYTSEDKLEDMARTFLSSLFQVNYEGMYSGEKNRARTTMLAYDDAIHGVTGKAGENRIFDLEFDFSKYKTFFEVFPKIHIINNGYERLEERIKSIAKLLHMEIEWSERAGEDARTVELCESIFALEDRSREKAYIDLSDCILDTEEDWAKIQNYQYSKQSFIHAQLPIFMENMRVLREKWKE